MAKFPHTKPNFSNPAPQLRDQQGKQRYARIRTFTRRGERMSLSLSHTWEQYGPQYLLDLPRGFGHTTVSTDVDFDPVKVFGRQAPLVVEVGCGNGAQIARAAAEDPSRNFLGFEVWLPGLAKAVSLAQYKYGGLDNLRLIQLDATQALPVLLQPGSLSELWSFFPDPWPKARHHKRRLVGKEFADMVGLLLVNGGLWRMATDWMDYAWQMRDVIEDCADLVNAYAGQNPHGSDPRGDCGGFAPRFEGRIVTSFEARAIREGREVWDLCAMGVNTGAQ